MGGEFFLKATSSTLMLSLAASRSLRVHRDSGIALFAARTIQSGAEEREGLRVLSLRSSSPPPTKKKTSPCWS